ncbi:enoyl-CoA hydratase family protein [Amycolatopsis sp. FU40]|uniref:enoyl-CoA hydratase family protein n=1 Tax=Amycolatopsis sp. FU40 TaxID=2914159 RepID=UPI001F3AF8B1|nr:enoyl-CoA hydratase family protein [Amycolatopsis sp. FU40]UKD56864.1 enoyl-CoA hydratase family protein [Amycolatopsis sp. FU40]
MKRTDEDGIAAVVLDSPHNRNALSVRLAGELTAQLSRAAEDPAVRAVLLTHTGETFCSGIDLAEARAGTGLTAEQLTNLLRMIVEMPKPVVARVTGHARAGGLGLLGACDIVVASPAASFAFTEVRIGLAPAVLSTAVLPRVDSRAASRYYLTGERFDAAEAARIGLITLAADDVDEALEPVLAGLRAAAPGALAAAKHLTTTAARQFFGAHASELAALAGRLGAGAEAREGIASFLERRSPVWAATRFSLRKESR